MLLATALAVALLSPAGAGAAESFSMTPSTTQAGGHPNLSASIGLAASSGSGSPEAVGFYPSDGVVAFPYAVPACSHEDFADGECAPAAQVGVATFRADHEGVSSKLLGTAAVYVVESETGEFRELGAQIPILDATVSGPVTAEQGSELALEGFPESTPLRQLDLTLWGVPADPVHDSARFPKEGTPGCPGVADTSCIEPSPSNLPPTPFIEAPTQCAGPGVSYAMVETQAESHSFSEVPYPRSTGCDQLSFNPLVTLGSLPARAGASTGLDLNVSVPQTPSPTTPSPSELNAFSVDFKGAVQIDAGAGSGSHPVCGDVVPDEGPRCPEETRIGTATIDTPLSPTPLTGGIYFGEISPPLRLVWVSAAGSGIALELLFLIEPAVTGPMTLTLLEAPQLPLESIGVHFDGGEGSLFRTGRCGKHSPVAEALAWDEEVKTGPLQTMSLGQVEWNEGTAGPCPWVPAHVAVSLAPARLPADGVSATTATATVADFYGRPLPDEPVTFSSTDAGQRIGPVQGHPDGTYTAQISASLRPGISTISAADLATTPSIVGQATLEQAALPIGGPGPPIARRRTGRRARALKRCKRKHSHRARVRCRKRAHRLPR